MRVAIIAWLATVAVTLGGCASDTATSTSPAHSVAKVSGDGQTALVGVAVPTPPAVVVTNPTGQPVAGVAVTFAITAGGGSITGATATTDSAGVAAVGSWTLGAGSNTLTATASAAGASSVVFAATGVPLTALTVTITGGNNDSAAVGSAVNSLPSVKITDAHGNVFANVAVTFAVKSGGGVITGASTATNNAGIALLGSWTLGAGLNSLTAAVVGGGAPVTFTGVGVVPQSLSAGFWSYCALLAGAAYCWGYNADGELGNGTTTNSIVPVAVAGGLTFQSVSVGTMSACGLTLAGTAYCWGDNTDAQLGNGTTTSSLVPVPVSGGLTFQSLAVAQGWACGLTAAGAAYCWGYDGDGELGNGVATGLGSVPVLVAGGMTFKALAAAGSSCGLATSGAAFCWGLEPLGDGTAVNRSTPVPVAGGLVFQSLSAGRGAPCGLTAAGAAYCWGPDAQGQLGNGSFTQTPNLVPVAVVGGLAFQNLAVGNTTTCGLTATGAAYCWGTNAFGDFGTGAPFPNNSNIPVAAAEGLTFQALAAAEGNTCGVATSGMLYCWGTFGRDVWPTGSIIPGNFDPTVMVFPPIQSVH